MAKHKGWYVREHAPGKVQARAWDPAAQRYRTRVFGDGQRQQAREWAQDQHARFRLAVERLRDQTATADLVAQYLEELRRRQRRPHHVRDVERVLGSFARACPRLNHPRLRDQAREWLDGLQRADGRPLATSTRNRCLLHVRALIRYGLDEDWVTRDPLRRFAQLAPCREAKPQFTLAELEMLARAVGHPLHAYVCCMLYAGLRRSEPAKLRWGQIDWRGRVVRVVGGKGGKDRTVPLQEELAAILWGLGPGAADALVFPQYHGGDAMAVIPGLYRLLAALGIERRGRTPHSLRHCYAGLMTATGMPTMAVVFAMGHDDMQTSKGYSLFAQHYQSEAQHWPAGQFQFVRGWCSALAPLPAAATTEGQVPATREPPVPVDPDAIMSVREVRALARCRLKRVQDAVRDGSLPVVGYGPRRAAQIRRADAEAWVALLERGG